MKKLMAVMGDGPVLDPFMGSGTVGLAAFSEGKPYIGIECEQAYFEIACRRLEEAIQGDLSDEVPR